MKKTLRAKGSYFANVFWGVETFDKNQGDKEYIRSCLNFYGKDFKR